MNMLESIITSKTRVKLLMKFFLNPYTNSYLREIATEFSESTNGVRVELNRLTKAGLLLSKRSGRLVEYTSNKEHQLFNEITSIVQKFVGIDQVIDKLVLKLGDVKSAYIIGDYARGIDSGIIDILLIGDINKTELARIVDNASFNINRKIRYLILTKKEFQKLSSELRIEKALLIWGDEIAETEI